MTEQKGPARRVPDGAIRPLDELELKKQLDRLSEETGMDALLVFFYRKGEQIMHIDPQPSTEEFLRRVAAEAGLMGMESLPIMVGPSTPDDPSCATVKVDRAALQRAMEAFRK